MLLETRSQFASTMLDDAADTDDSPISNMPTQNHDELDDIFFPADHDDVYYSTDLGEQRPSVGGDVSDMPRLRSTHNTAGYRDGVSASKEAHVQDGFDEGYTLGAEIGTRVGWILGVLESLAFGTTEKRSVSSSPQAEENGSADEQNENDIRLLLAQARLDLTAKNIYSQTYFHEDGLWKYDVPVADSELEDTDLTFRNVASSHPLVLKWNKAVDLAASDVGARLDVLKDQEHLP
jgi:hypothetical protein